MTPVKLVSDDPVDILARVMNSEQRKSYGKLQENDAVINREYAEKLAAALKRVGYQIVKRSEQPAPVRDNVLRCSACGHVSL